MKHIVSFSGGKDSTAMLIRMIELNMPINEIVFADTGLEFPELYDYIKKVEDYVGRKIKIIKNNHNFDFYFYKEIKRGKRQGEIYGFPKVVVPCWAQDRLKVRPQKRLFKNKKCLFYIGYALGEEKRIMKNSNFKYPLIDWGWTEKKCFNYLKEKGLANPLYKKFKRLGCWLCPKQPTKDLRYIFENHPKLWLKLLQYEKDSPHGFKPDIQLKDLEKKWKYQTKLNKFANYV